MDASSIRKIVLSGNLKNIEYVFHPVPGNIEIDTLCSNFWCIFSSLPSSLLESKGQEIFKILDKCKHCFPPGFFLKNCRRCSTSSLPMLYWIVFNLAKETSKRDEQKTYRALEKEKINSSAMRLFNQIRSEF